MSAQVYFLTILFSAPLIPPLPEMPVHSSKRTGSLGFLSLSTLLWVLPTLPDKWQATTPAPPPWLCTNLACPFWSLSQTPSTLNLLTTHLALTLTLTCTFKLDSGIFPPFFKILKAFLKDRDHISSFAKVPWIAKCHVLCKSFSVTPGLEAGYMSSVTLNIPSS